MAAAEPTTEVQGLSSAEAAQRLRELGPVEQDSSRSLRSIVLANVLTLFNAIILVFFLLVLSQGLWADALFGVIAIVNSAIGIRQEVKAKETLDNLALLVAPQAEVVRDGHRTELRADELVPGDVVRVEPGDQLIADGPVISSRGLTVDESLLTGEADGIGKQPGDRMLSGAFCISGSGYYEIDAVRGDSYAEKIAGEAKEFRHPPSPLQLEVNQILTATTIIMVPLAILMFARVSRARRRLHRGRPDGDRRSDHADPGGPRPADERDARGRRGAARAHGHPRPADERNRIAGRGGHDLRR